MTSDPLRNSGSRNWAKLIQGRYVSSFSLDMSLVAIEAADLPQSFKQDCMHLVKKAKVALPFELTTCSHLLYLISH